VSEQEKNPYIRVESWLVFGWLCLECSEVNQISYSTWENHEGLTECTNCEKAFIIKVPWND